MPPTQTAPTRLVGSDAGTDVADAQRVHALPVGASTAALSTAVDHVSPGRATHTLRPADVAAWLRVTCALDAIDPPWLAAIWGQRSGRDAYECARHLMAIDRGDGVPPDAITREIADAAGAIVRARAGA